MKKTLILSCALAMVLGTVALAQDSVIWLDVRDNSGATYQSITTPVVPFTNGQGIGESAFNAGGRGDGQILRLNPTVSNNFHIRNAWPNFDGDGNLATGKLHIFMDVADKPAVTGDMISSVGFNINIADNAAGGRNRIATIDYAWNAALFAEANAGKVNGAIVPGNPPSWAGAKAVKVPVVAGPVYNTTNGLVPGGPYRLGALTVTAGPRTAGATGHAANSTFKVNLAVNNLLITRVGSAGTPGDEMVSFGYVGATPDTPVNGSTVGATSTAPDALIVIQMKADNNGNGTVTGVDSPGYNAAFTAGNAIKQVQAFLWNNNTTPTVTGADSPLYSQAFAAPLP